MESAGKHQVCAMCSICSNQRRFGRICRNTSYHAPGTIPARTRPSALEKFQAPKLDGGRFPPICAVIVESLRRLLHGLTRIKLGGTVVGTSRCESLVDVATRFTLIANVTFAKYVKYVTCVTYVTYFAYFAYSAYFTYFAFQKLKRKFDLILFFYHIELAAC